MSSPVVESFTRRLIPGTIVLSILKELVPGDAGGFNTDKRGVGNYIGNRAEEPGISIKPVSPSAGIGTAERYDQMVLSHNQKNFMY